MKHPAFHLILLCLLCSAGSGFSQGWTWLRGTTSFYSGAFVDGEGISVDTHGNIYTLGYLGLTGGPSGEITQFGTHQVTDSSTFPQMYIAKSNSAGTYLWVTASQNTGGYPIAIATDASGNVYLYGTYAGSCHFTSPTISSGGGWAYFLAKFDSSGNIQWLKNVVLVDSIPLHLSTSGIAVDRSGAVYVTGSFPNASVTIGTSTLTNADATGHTFDIFAAKYDPLGNVTWATSFGGGRNEQVEAISVTNGGDAYLAGFYYSSTMAFGSTSLTNSAGGLDTPYVFLAKLDGSGTPLWATSTRATKNDNIGSMACDKFDDAYLAGGFFNPHINFGSLSLSNAGGEDAYVVKYSSAGTPVYANSIGGINIDQSYCVSVDSCEHMWVCGQMGGTGIGAYSINIGTHVLNTPSGDNDPLFIVEFDSSGNYVNALATQSGGEDQGNIIGVDNQGNLYLGADYDVSSFTLGSTTLSLGSTTIENMFLAKYNYGLSSCGASTLETPEEQAAGLRLYPNPVTSELTISSSAIISKVEVLNLVGQVVCQRTGNSTELQVNLSALRAGVYFVRVNGCEVRKVVKE